MDELSAGVFAAGASVEANGSQRPHTGKERRRRAYPHPFSTRTVSALSVLALVLVSACAIVLCLGGCGKEPLTRSEQEEVAERVLRAVAENDGMAFLGTVAPSYLDQARSEMPYADDGMLGDVLLAGYAQKVPFRRMTAPVFQVSVEGDKAVVHVWGDFLGAEGQKVTLAEGQALRIPLVREGDRWYLDLLDL